MYTDEVAPGVGLFGQPLRVAAGSAHQNRPHFTTLKALQVVSAAQYAFSAVSIDNRREHQGWGFPDLQAMYDRRDRTYIVDETLVLGQSQVHTHQVAVGAGEASLKISLNWNEPAGNPSAASQLVNNLSLRVTAPNGTQYWGNYGLEIGNWSLPGGFEDSINSIENVFVANPAAGNWQVEVLGSAIVIDNHIETLDVDADYALVAVGGTGQLIGGGTFATTSVVGHGCGGTAVVCDQAIYEYPTFDFQNSSFTLAFADGVYTLVPGAGTWITPVNAQGFADDTITMFALPFGLPTPDGTTNELYVSSNGWITSGPYVGSSSWTPDVTTFLQNEMWAAIWRDLNPGAGGDVYFDSNAARAVVSWVNVPNYGGASSNTLQVQFWQNGDVHFLYQAISVSGNYLVGYSLANAVDPGGSDISLVLNDAVTVCSPVSGTPDVALLSSARPILGTSFDLVTTNVPPTALLSLSILSLSQLPGGIDLAAIGMPGCSVYQPLDLLLSFPVAQGTGLLPVTLPGSPALVGGKILSQSAVLVPNINPFEVVVSNGLQLLLGDV
jgi:hypothetical protein